VAASEPAERSAEAQCLGRAVSAEAARQELAMSVFGPKYSLPFQAVINHAERFCALLGRLEEGSPPGDSLGRGWIVGRRSEIEAVLALIVDDWADEGIDADRATRCAASYLDELHEAAQTILGVGLVLDCCAEDEALTPSIAREDDSDTGMVIADESMRREANSTWFDPSALLEFRELPSVAREGGAGRRGRTG
jgi:hypothetical protein